MNGLRKAVGLSSKKKAKKPKEAQTKNQGEGHGAKKSRCPNWTDEESEWLLNVAEELLLSSGKRDLNFKDCQLNKLCEMYNSKGSFIHRTPAHVDNRLKTLKKDFSIFKELANKSGWGWDPDNHVPIAPHETAWQELMNDGTSKFLYFDRKTFPLYEKMNAMCGGKMANGDKMYTVCTGANSATGSETGSSENPNAREAEFGDAFPNPGWNGDNSEMEDTVQQPTPQSASQSIPDTLGGSRNSGSQKRKSTDDGPEPSRGKKIQRRISEKSKGIQTMADASDKLVKLNEQLVDELGRANKIKEERNRILDEKEREYDKCMDKLNGLRLDPISFHIMRGKFKEPDDRRYFLRATEEEITNWIGWIRFQGGFGMQGGMNQTNQQGGVNQGHSFYFQPGGMSNTSQDPYGMYNAHMRPPQP